MPIVFPTASALGAQFSASNPTSFLQPRRTPREAPEHIWSAWSTSDDVKSKAAQVSDQAVKEYEKASAKAQQKVGKIEMFSAKYYAACTFGGLMACVSIKDPPAIVV
jgi:solute carrier family 25 phosphate transporter 3